MSRDFYTLRVKATHEEIGGQARTVQFDVPSELRETFRWRAGQHITLRQDIAGEEERRSYSISSSPHSGDPLQITVKRVADGRMSNHINDTVREGDLIDVMPPFGGFCLDPGEKERRTHYFFGAGSGITPLKSMISSVLAQEPYSVAHLLYGNKNADSILFRETFEDHVAENGERLSVAHILSAPSWLSSFSYWRSGQIDKEAIEAFIAEHPPYAQDAQYYVCGPGTMNATVKASLMALDVPAERIHMESYGGSIEADLSVQGVAANTAVTLGGRTIQVPVAADQTLLEAARSAGLSPPFSCQSGVCGACRAKLVKGEVHMRARMALEDSDIEKGAILTCQSVARTADLEIDYGA